MERVSVYVDGLNFYYGLKRFIQVDNDWKKFYWIDFVQLFEHYNLKNHVLQKVYYFSTPPLNILKSNRQGKLFEANKLLNGDRFEVVTGKFYEKMQRCPVCNATFTKPEEKRTDVNISVQMMLDCAMDNTDVLILVSADSDLFPPLEAIKKEYPAKKIRIFFPPKSFSYDLSNFIKANKGKIIFLERGKKKFSNSIMPDVVTVGNNSSSIPQHWKVAPVTNI